MTLISWDEAATLNVAEMDAQHQKLFTLVSKLRQAMTSPYGGNVVSQALEELIEFTRLHFATEETLMTRYGYPDYDKHKQEHEQVLQDVDKLHQRYRNGDALAPFAIELDLEAWAYKHIESSDRSLAEFLNTQVIY